MGFWHAVQGISLFFKREAGSAFSMVNCSSECKMDGCFVHYPPRRIPKVVRLAVSI